LARRKPYAPGLKRKRLSGQKHMRVYRNHINKNGNLSNESSRTMKALLWVWKKLSPKLSYPLSLMMLLMTTTLDGSSPLSLSNLLGWQYPTQGLPRIQTMRPAL
jgi:hypothetical protein